MRRRKLACFLRRYAGGSATNSLKFHLGRRASGTLVLSRNNAWYGTRYRIDRSGNLSTIQFNSSDMPPRRLNRRALVDRRHLDHSLRYIVEIKLPPPKVMRQCAAYGWLLVGLTLNAYETNSVRGCDRIRNVHVGRSGSMFHAGFTPACPRVSSLAPLCQVR
jgi:hypothetical protein